MTHADRLAEALDEVLASGVEYRAEGYDCIQLLDVVRAEIVAALSAYRAAPPVDAIPASKVRDLARAWTTRGKSEDAYREGHDDARNACADALDAVLHEAGVIE